MKNVHIPQVHVTPVQIKVTNNMKNVHIPQVHVTLIQISKACMWAKYQGAKMTKRSKIQI